MLGDILDEFGRTRNTLYFQDVSKRLGKEPAVVEGMLELLVRVGRLVEVNGARICDSCPMRAKCLCLKSSHRTFSLASEMTLDFNESVEGKT
ncbi:MAG: hypothetical protein GTO14_16530 [Anaerolineales bacterium]|nr:hypothetical protein [Anaerolineales bacterium]